MNAIMNEKGRQTKLLAAIAIIAMVVCAFAAVMPSVDATENGYTETSEGVKAISGDNQIGTPTNCLRSLMKTRNMETGSSSTLLEPTWF